MPALLNGSHYFPRLFFERDFGYGWVNGTITATKPFTTKNIPMARIVRVTQIREKHSATSVINAPVRRTKMTDPLSPQGDAAQRRRTPYPQVTKNVSMDALIFSYT
ncbi:MAG: hypothetical protein ACYCQL_01330 [Acidithiobacillus sp.]